MGLPSWWTSTTQPTILLHNAASIAASTRLLRSIDVSLCADARVAGLKLQPSDGDREAGAAAAGGDGVRVPDLEALADQVVDIIDLGAAHEFEAERVDEDGGAVLGEDQVVVGRGFVHDLVFVLEAGAAAARHDDAEHRAGRLFGQHTADLFGGAIGENDRI